MSHEVLFGSGRPHRRRSDLAGGDLKIGDQCLGSMPHVFKLHALDQARLYGSCGMGPFMGLNAGLFIRAHDMYTLFMQCWDLLIQRAERLDLGIKVLRVLRSRVIEPIPRRMGFEVHFFVKNARRCGGKWWGQYPA